MKNKNISDRLLELIGAGVIALGIIVGNSEESSAQELYNGDNHGGNISHPPDGSVLSAELTEKFGYPTAVDTVNNTYYMYVVSHWFDPQDIAQFPSDVMMYGVAPYDYSSSE